MKYLREDGQGKSAALATATRTAGAMVRVRSPSYERRESTALP